MENIYIVILGILFLLAISDLIVGVSNDAVNFLNSAIGAKAAPFWIIMVIASAGVLFGATFSDGMMEIARKGVFYPQNFYFSEIMIIFLAVMITDVILLDVFNAIGLPTSTTVSIVFELLGSSVAIALIKIKTLGLSLSSLSNYINSSSALVIIFGILISIVIAFLAGAIIQYIIRLLFTFNIKKHNKYFGAIWGGIAITAITYFLLIKGAKGSSVVSSEQIAWIKDHTFRIIILSLTSWTIILQLLLWLVNLNILRVTVLFGTFALAMAFAGNDLVNFIGVPLAGLKSFQAFIANPGADPNAFAMIALTGKIKTEIILLIIAGFIMVITLWLSRKAKNVTATTLDLSRQDEGEERFGSSSFSRTIVRNSIKVTKAVQFVVPNLILKNFEKRFDRNYPTAQPIESGVSFDMLRASVNLVVASVIISFATSLKLPLSTTYVTFMVAMGTSLSDGAWGRESAVYRITGVLTVIGGWFFTAFIAFTASLIIAFLIHFGSIYAIIALVILAGILLYRSQILFKKRESKKLKSNLDIEELSIKTEDIHDKCSNNVTNVLLLVSEVYKKAHKGLATENRKTLKHLLSDINELNTDTKYLKDHVHKTIHKLEEDSIESGHYYVQVLDYLREIVHSISFIVKPAFDHVDNNHKALLKEQILEFEELNTEIQLLSKQIIQMIISSNFSTIEETIKLQQDIINIISADRKKQIKRIKKEQTGTKNSILYLNLLAETKNLILHSINLLKSYRDFTIPDTKNDFD